MRLVLDTNEFLFSFGSERDPACLAMLGKFITRTDEFEIRICRTIVDEVRRNSAGDSFRKFWVFLAALGVEPDEDWAVPFDLGAKYESMGLKPGDAFIAAYTEYVGAEFLISENRKDFLNHPEWFKFKVSDAAAFLKKFP